MCESNRDISKMIQLRHQRPAFARMISWEFSNVKEPRQKKKLKQRRKHASGPVNTEITEGDDDEDEEEATSSESSEYDTACEDEADISNLSLSQSSSFVTGSTTGSVGSPDANDDSNSEGDVFGDQDDIVVASAASNTADIQHRKKLTKRQKRRKRDEFKVIYANEFLVIGDLCDLDADIDNTLLEINESLPAVDVERPVPSLVELCLRTSHKKPRLRSKSSTSEPPRIHFSLPPGIRNVARTFGSHFQLQQHQLKVLQNHILPASVSICEDGFCHSKDGTSFCWPLRSIWSLLPYHSNSDDVHYPSSRNSAYLLNLNYHYKEDWHLNMIHQYSYRAESFYTTYLARLPLSLSAYATTIDLMLPGTVWNSKFTDPSLTEDERMSKQIQCMTVRVKNALKLRFSGMTDMLFEKMLPYVMWARGQITMAAEMFRSLIAKETSSLHKAMYLSEIGRMHAQFGDTSTATRLYRLAGEAALEEKCQSVDDTINEITEQTQVLLASVNDTGLLSKEKASLSMTHWGGARKTKRPKVATVLASFDSLLCYHAAHLTGDWVEEALVRLKDQQSYHPVLCYISSMLLAVQGLTSKSDTMYKAARTSFFEEYLSSAATSVKTDRKIKNPFQPIIDMVTKMKSPLKPLKVVWRSQLSPPNLEHKSNMEAQVNVENLHLRLDENGCITGDMEMLLPPMRNISLNPYTGSLVFNHIPSNTGTWRSVSLKKQCHHSYKLLPSPVLLLDHEDGTNVHLLTPGVHITRTDDAEAIDGSLTLYWRDPTGSTAKINLYKTLQTSYLQDLQKQVELKKLDEETHNANLHIIELCRKKNICLNINSVSNYAQRYKKLIHDVSTNGRSIKKKEKKKDKRNTNALAYFKICGFALSFDFIQEPLVFGKTLVLYVEDSNKDKYLVFVNASSRETFLQPVVEIMQKRPLEWPKSIKPSSDSDFIFCYLDKQLAIYNQFGTCTYIPETEHLNRFQMPNETFCPVVTGGKVYGLNRSRTSVWSHLIGTPIEDNDRKSKDRSTLFDNLCTWEIASYWDLLAEKDDARVICDLEVVGRQVQGSGHLLMVVMSVGLGFMDPETLTFVPIVLEEGILAKTTDDGKVLKGYFETCKLLEQKHFMHDNKAVCLVAISVQNKLLVFELSHSTHMQDQGTSVKLLNSFTVPGAAVDMCFVGNGHMLVSVTHNNKEVANYREHVYLFSLDGYCKGVLLSLGPGPRSFLPVYLHGNGEGEPAGWMKTAQIQTSSFMEDAVVKKVVTHFKDQEWDWEMR